jgi:excisionase family DNA binding protein
MSKLLLSRREAASSLSISLRCIDKLIETEQLSPTRIGRRVLVHIDEAEAFAAKGSITGTKAR